MLIAASQTFLEPSYLREAEALATVAWDRGILTKGVGLCHGIGGNGYAFLSLYRATGNALYLARARCFAGIIGDKLNGAITMVSCSCSNVECWRAV